MPGNKREVSRWPVWLVAGVAVLAGAAGAAERASTRELSLGFAAKVLCSTVFVAGLPVDDALEHSVYPTMFEDLGLAPADLERIEVDRNAGRVTLGTADGLERTAAFHGESGCVLHPRARDGVLFKPQQRAAPATTDDVRVFDEAFAWDGAAVDVGQLEQAMDEAFAPAANTAAFVVVHKGTVVGERYGAGADRNTALVGWSMGKSITAALLGVLIQQGEELTVDAPAPVPAWQGDGDPRKAIRLADLLHMSSGLSFSTFGDPRNLWRHAHPDHMYVYSGANDVFAFSEQAELEHAPNTVGRYRNCDPLIVGSIIRRTVEARGQNYLSFPRTDLFDRVGIRKMVLEPDPSGNFVMTGFVYGRARDWARLGQLWLQDGVWRDERILPQGWSALVATPAPAWEAPEYGGLFWLNRTRRWNLPEDAYYMSGGGGQYTFVIPSLDLVVVRLGHYKGGLPAAEAALSPADTSLNGALALVVGALK